MAETVTEPAPSGVAEAGTGIPGQRIGGSSPLTFPDLPRLELDALLGQLVERAREVMATQGRLRGLLQATSAVSGTLVLATVLRRTVRAARELVGARYAALGVVDPGGGLIDFLHEGMPADAVERIGDLPQGKGLLGALVDDPTPIRLTRLGEDPRSAGFPPGHPPMTSFLGAPIHVRGELYGNLYLTDSVRPDGAFTAEDEQLLTALAATAGVAVGSARLYEQARARGEWLQASAAVTRQLLAPSAEDVDPLELIAARTLDIAGADLVVVLFPDPADAALLRIAVSAGVAAARLRGLSLPIEDSFSGRVFSTGRPGRLEQLSEGHGVAALVSGDAEVGSVLAVPLAGAGQVHGVLSVARLVGRPGFDPADVDMVASFANHAAVAVELADARRRQESAALLDDRERIAADLHDHVIQRLFGAGLGLQTVAAGLGSSSVPERRRMADRVQTTIRDLDATIQQIRTTIFALQQGAPAGDAAVRPRLIDVIADVTAALGFQPGLRFSGLLEGVLPDPVVDDLLLVLREALTNVARHAGAGAADVEISSLDGRLTLRVSDDGRGIGATSRRSGLATLGRRAEAHGGSLTVAAGDPSGTELTWSVPLDG